MVERVGRERATGARAAASLLRRNRDFRRLFLASVISLGGDWFLFVALGGLVIEVTGEAFAVGVLIMAQELPVFLATPWAGWLAELQVRLTGSRWLSGEGRTRSGTSRALGQAPVGCKRFLVTHWLTSENMVSSKPSSPWSAP